MLFHHDDSHDSNKVIDDTRAHEELVDHAGPEVDNEVVKHGEGHSGVGERVVKDIAIVDVLAQLVASSNSCSLPRSTTTQEWVEPTT
jgi:hypothetical protein